MRLSENLYLSTFFISCDNSHLRDALIQSDSPHRATAPNKYSLKYIFLNCLVHTMSFFPEPMATLSKLLVLSNKYSRFKMINQLISN